MTNAEFRELALSFPETVETPHFERSAFKVIKRRTFATLHEKSHSANLKLQPIDQSAFSTFGKSAIYPVPNKWGQQGWTTFQLDELAPELVADAMQIAYKEAVNSNRRKK